MLDQEASVDGLNSLFWKQCFFADGVPFFYSSLLGELRLEPPPLVRGGLLTEEMGLGKTLECVALILATKHPSPFEANRRAQLVHSPPHPHALLPSNATLVIVPEPLVSQWEAEIAKSSAMLNTAIYVKQPRRQAKGTLTSRTYIASIFRKFSPRQNSITDSVTVDALLTFAGFIPALNEDKLPSFLRKRCTMERFITAWHAREIASVDVVVTTFGTVKADASGGDVLSKIHWLRVMIDEMQFIRSPTTHLAKATKRLSCRFRWMISGTPLYSSVNDLNGELQFLGIVPFCLDDRVDGFWGMKVKGPFERRDPQALEVVAQLLDRIMIRHSKVSKACVR